MSLLTRKAPHTVYVILREKTREANGMEVYRPVGDPIPVKCAVQPARDWSDAEETMDSFGFQVTDLRVVLAREWHGDVHSHVLWDGDLYELVGQPQPNKMSRRTAHWRVTMKWIGKADG